VFTQTVRSRIRRQCKEIAENWAVLPLEHYDGIDWRCPSEERVADLQAFRENLANFSGFFPQRYRLDS